MASKPIIAISTGDPHGIGPEITRAALGDAGVKDVADFVVFGELHPGEPARRGPNAASGRASFDAVEGAIDAVKSGRAHAMVTAPISKEAWHAAGITAWPGHTELLAQRFESPDSGMLFVGPTLRVMLVTIHVPLASVSRIITAEKVLGAITLAHRACMDMGIERPRIGVAGINPHAGEHGLLGDEDDRHIAPGVERARAMGLCVSGPIPGDAVFVRALRGEFDVVVAMYHDQGLIPAKLIDGYRCVNMTVGLSWQGRRVVRTSPAHGTAFDIAGTGQADPSSMIEAILLAARLASVG